MKTTNRNPWFTCPEQRPNAELKLFCIPYAGGSTAAFASWSRKLPSFVEVCSIQLPGRGVRLKEPAPVRLVETAQTIAAGIVNECKKKNFAFFGHSMGAMLAFEIARFMRDKHRQTPAEIFVSGRRAPQVPDTDAPTYNLPEDDFIEELRRMKGTPEAVLTHPELLQLFLPVLRADFEACHTYDYSDGAALSCPITAYCGIDDNEETQERMMAWSEQTSSSFRLHMIPGSHFFIHESEAELLGSLSAELVRLMRG